MVSNFHPDLSCLGLRQRSLRHLELVECSRSSFSYRLTDEQHGTQGVNRFLATYPRRRSMIDLRIRSANGEVLLSELSHIFTSSRHGVTTNGPPSVQLVQPAALQQGLTHANAISIVCEMQGVGENY